MRLILTLAFVLFTACEASAQAPKPTPAPTPAEGTKLEKFQARTGAVIVKGYSVIGQLTGTGGTVDSASLNPTISPKNGLTQSYFNNERRTEFCQHSGGR
jgi:hypothetical protein